MLTMLKTRQSQGFARVLAIAVAWAAVSLPAGAARAEDEFPHRKKYPQLAVISTEELHKALGSVVIVDVRSKFEFDVIHVKDAVHVPMSNQGFVSALEKIRGRSGGKKLVFYCNGHSCEKSYEAGKEATDAGFKDLVVYDAGVMEWVKAYPDLGMLFGSSPVDKSKLIAKADFKARNLGFSEFVKKAGDPKAMAVDVRDPVQVVKKKAPDSLKGVRNIPLDKLLQALEAGHFKEKTLLFMDAVGKQTQWLQYHLEKHGYKDYHFLEGGVDALKM